MRVDQLGHGELLCRQDYVVFLEGRVFPTLEAIVTETPAAVAEGDAPRYRDRAHRSGPVRVVTRRSSVTFSRCTLSLQIDRRERAGVTATGQR